MLFLLGNTCYITIIWEKTLNKICGSNALSAGHEAKFAGSLQEKDEAFESTHAKAFLFVYMLCYI